jgi:hypothetical protein
MAILDLAISSREFIFVIQRTSRLCQNSSASIQDEDLGVMIDGSFKSSSNSHVGFWADDEPGGWLIGSTIFRPNARFGINVLLLQASLKIPLPQLRGIAFTGRVVEGGIGSPTFVVTVPVRGPFEVVDRLRTRGRGLQ